MTKEGVAKKSMVRWYAAVVILGLTVIAAAREIQVVRANNEWVTINLPNPPAPIAYDSAAPATVAVN